jgi:lipoprotein-releasing system ATP-binding protein
MIKAKGLNKFYDNLQVLKNVSITIKQGEIISIVGASGAGKSTLLQILGTLDKPSFLKNYKDSANIEPILEIDDQNVLNLNDSALSKFRNLNLGFIFQFHQLLPEFTALENVCIPAFIANKGKNETETEAKKLLEYLGLSHRLHHKPAEMSGGEQQRTAVARALINKPKIVFADEPSGNLDTISAENLHNLFFDLRKDFGQTFVIVTHNDDFANMADRKLTMVDGSIISDDLKIVNE